MSATSSALLATARAQLGKGQYEFPKGSNKTYFGKHYGWDGVAWCAQATWYCFDTTAGAGKLVPKTASTVAMRQWFMDRGRFGQEPRPGAVVFFNFGTPKSRKRPLPDHVGIVEAVESRAVIITLEGNTSSGAAGSQADGDGFFRRARSTAQVVGYGYPAYDDVRTISVAKGVSVGALAVALGMSVGQLLVLNPSLGDESSDVRPGTAITAPATSAPTPRASDGTVIATPAPSVSAPAVSAPAPSASTPSVRTPTSSVSTRATSLLQSELNTLGAGLVVDGVAGPATTAAVRAFQADHGLAADGVAGPLTRAAMKKATATYLTGTVRYGATGPQVRLVQSKVGVKVDGAFGRATQRAVEAAQRKKLGAAEVDGVVGGRTARALGITYKVDADRD